MPSGGARSFDRSLSDRGNWFDRSNSTSGGGVQPGEEGGGPPNGSISPRKSYSRAPYDDWRKPASATSGGDQEEEVQGGGGGPGGGWRSGPSSSGRRWNAPPGSEGGRGINNFQNDFYVLFSRVFFFFGILKKIKIFFLRGRN